MNIVIDIVLSMIPLVNLHSPSQDLYFIAFEHNWFLYELKHTINNVLKNDLNDLYDLLLLLWLLFL